MLDSLNEDIQHQKEETYPLRLMRHECTKHGLDFINHYAIRNLLYNGDFFGITTFKEWNTLAEDEMMIERAKDHFLNEAKFVAMHNIQYVVRSKDLANNPFLYNLVDAGMCNGIGIYIINNIGITVYFFNAKHDEKEAVHFLINHLNVLKSIVDKVDSQLIQDGYWNNLLISSQNKNLFSNNEKRVIFSHRKDHQTIPTKLLLNNKMIEFTPREIQILDVFKNTNAIKKSSTIKKLAVTFNIGSRTIEWHLEQLKEKTGMRGKDELIDFAKTL